MRGSLSLVFLALGGTCFEEGDIPQRKVQKIYSGPITMEDTSSWDIFVKYHLPQLRRHALAVVVHRPTYALVDSLLAKGMMLRYIYVPEHGLFGEGKAGAVIRDTTYRGIPVISLYGKRKSPTTTELQNVGAILFALRDVGVRHYTYLSTLAYVLRAAYQAKVPAWILDFPNPHAHYAYGPLLDSSLFSFIGMYPVPLVPGFTIGEYARLLVGEKWVPPVQLHVVPWKGWKRGGPLPPKKPFFSESPSPALKDNLAIELYPILGWYEGVRPISVGRGTEKPFKQVGIKGIDRLPFGDTVIYGYRLIPVIFQPNQEKTTYTGWEIRREYAGPIKPDSLFRLGFFLLHTFYKAYPDKDFYDEEFFDKLFGTSLLRWMVEKHLPVDTLYASFQVLPSWDSLRTKYLIYE
ncbi:MAG: DUF1343 domain-containing protein [Bacteroidia bacterium]|nr:DUF1343 domain-containing protein [Bacteroidia bacterium]MDW8134290.1 DUF1343 domain-containing protein [Bacteroidia bacterium]